MNRHSLIPAVAACILLVALVGCGSQQHPAADLVTPLTKLAESAQGVVSFGDAKARASEEALLAEALKGKPELEPLAQKAMIRLRFDENNVVVLVCKKDGSCAWLETAGWTPLEVKKHYLTNPPPPAAFTIELPKKEPAKTQ